MATCSSTNSSSARKLSRDKPMCWDTCSKVPGTSYDSRVPSSCDLPATVHLPDGEERYFRGNGRSGQIPIIPPGEGEDERLESRSLPNERRGCLVGSPSQPTPQPQPPWPSPHSVNGSSCVLPPPNRCVSELHSCFTAPGGLGEQKRLAELRKHSPLPPLASFRNLAKNPSNSATDSPPPAFKLFPTLDSSPPDSSPTTTNAT